MTDQTLYLWWEARDPSQADDARRLARFASGLPDFDPIYRSWLDSPETRKETVPLPLSEAAARRLLIDNIAHYEAPSPDVRPRPWPELGSTIWGGHAGPPSYDFRESSYADTTCHIGAFSQHGPVHPNHVFMRLSEVRPSAGRPWRATELRPLIKFARDIWNPAEMCAMFSFYDLPSVPDVSPNGLRFTEYLRQHPNIVEPKEARRILKPWIGWITWLPPDLAARAKVPADVEVETLPDGSALITLCEEPFGKDDAAGLARLHALEAALRPIQN